MPRRSRAQGSARAKGQAPLNNKQKNQVRSLVKSVGETKHRVDYEVPYGIPVGGVTKGGFAAMAQGIGFNQRVGDTIEPINVRIRGRIRSGTATGIVRLVLIRWIENSATAATAADIVTGGFLGNDFAPLTPIVQGTNRTLFNVLWDQTYTLDAATDVRYFDKTIKLSSKIKYSAAGTNHTGALYLMAISDHAITGAPTIMFSYHLKYKDA